MAAQQISFYDTVSDMVADSDLAKGDRAQTSGYYAVEDSGATRYLISDSKDSDQAIKLNNGLFSNPKFGYEVSFRQLGIRNDDEIEPYIRYACYHPNHRFVFPAGTYVSKTSGNTYELTERGEVEIGAENGVSIEVSGENSSTNDSAVFRISPKRIGDPQIPINRDHYSGTSTFSPVNVPEGVNPGDLILTYANRGGFGENRGRWMEGQVNRISHFHPSGEIVLDHTNLLDYQRNYRITGEITTVSTVSKAYVCEVKWDINGDELRRAHGRRYTWGVANFADGKSLRGAMGHYLTDAEQGTGQLVYWRQTGSVKPSVGKLEVTNIGGCAFFPDISFKMTDRIVWNSVPNKMKGVDRIFVWDNLTNLSISKSKINGFLGPYVYSIYGCYKARVWDNDFSINNSALGATGDSTAITCQASHDALFFDNRFKGYWQAFNFGGTNRGDSNVSFTFCGVKNNKMIGGGIAYDGQQMNPADPILNTRRLEKPAPSLAHFHGNGFMTTLEGNICINASMGNNRADGTNYINNEFYGDISDTCIDSYGGRGNKIIGNRYFAELSTEMMDNPDYSDLWKTENPRVPNSLIAIKGHVSCYDECGVTVITDNHADCVTEGLIQFRTHNSGRRPVKNIVLGNNTLGYAHAVPGAPRSPVSIFNPLYSGEPWTPRAESSFIDLGGNKVINYKDPRSNGAVVDDIEYYWFMRPVLGHTIRIGECRAVTSVPSKGVSNINLGANSISKGVLDIMDRITGGSDYYAIGAYFRRGQKGFVFSQALSGIEYAGSFYEGEELSSDTSTNSPLKIGLRDGYILELYNDTDSEIVLSVNWRY